MEYHEAANIFPLEEETLDELAEDIRQHGQRIPIETLDGKILDGRRRFLACERAGVEPFFVAVNVDDPVSYVISLNLHRRHLSESQRALVGARAMEYHAKQAKERQRASGGDKKSNAAKSVMASWPQPISGEGGLAREHAGKAVGVGGRTIDRAVRVLREAEPEVIKAVEEDRMKVTWASEVSQMPADEQRAIAAEANGRKPPVKQEVPEPEPGEIRGYGVLKAHEAIAILKTISLNDPLRKRGFQIVRDYINN